MYTRLHPSCRKSTGLSGLRHKWNVARTDTGSMGPGHIPDYTEHRETRAMRQRNRRPRTPTPSFYYDQRPGRSSVVLVYCTRISEDPRHAPGSGRYYVFLGPCAAFLTVLLRGPDWILRFVYEIYEPSTTPSHPLVLGPHRIPRWGWHRAYYRGNFGLKDLR